MSDLEDVPRWFGQESDKPATNGEGSKTAHVGPLNTNDRSIADPSAFVLPISNDPTEAAETTEQVPAIQSLANPPSTAPPTAEMRSQPGSTLPAPYQHDPYAPPLIGEQQYENGGGHYSADGYHPGNGHAGYGDQARQAYDQQPLAGYGAGSGPSGYQQAPAGSFETGRRRRRSGMLAYLGLGAIVLCTAAVVGYFAAPELLGFLPSAGNSVESTGDDTASPASNAASDADGSSASGGGDSVAIDVGSGSSSTDGSTGAGDGVATDPDGPKLNVIPQDVLPPNVPQQLDPEDIKIIRPGDPVEDDRPVSARTAHVFGETIYLRGRVPSQEFGDQIEQLVVGFMGEENVVNEYVVDPSVVIQEGEYTPVFFDRTIQFEADSAVIAPRYYESLDTAVQLMAQNENVELTIVSRTDASGEADYNLELSIARARAVLDYYVASGIDPARLTIVARGEEDAIESDDPEERAAQRNTEFIVSGLLG